MCAYLALKKGKEMQTGEQTKQSDSNSVPVKIEQTVKQFKTHWGTLDFDWEFINSVVMMRMEKEDEERSPKQHQ
jgi:hypothetical protein